MEKYRPAIQQRPDTSWLYLLASQLPLAPQQLETALQKLTVIPNKAIWLHWLNLLLLSVGSGLFLSGVMFFFAYNWEEMHRFTRFSLIASGVMITAISAWWYGVNTLIGKLLLTAAAVLTGVLLATFGMVYQTGADSFMLFSSWAILILPWVFVSRFQPLWLLTLILINTAVFTWASITPLNWHAPDQAETLALLIPSSINIIVLLLRELTSFIHQPIANARWFSRTLIFWLLCVLSYTPIHSAIETNISTVYQVFLILFYIFVLASLTYYTLFIRHDLLIFTCVLLSIIAVLISILTQLLDFGREPVINFMLMGLAIAGMTALASQLLLRTARKWEAITQKAIA